MKPSMVQMGVSHRFDANKMTRADFVPHDVATALSRINRYGGNGKFALSVGQHSLLLSYVVPDRLALAALTHDVPEMWTGDVLAPVKKECPDYNAVEERFTRKLATVLGIPYEQFLEVTPFDVRIAYDERAALFEGHEISEEQKFGIPVEPMNPDEVRDLWHRRFIKLTTEPTDGA